MFANILVPVDGTPESGAALPAAVTLARATGATITVMRVLHASASSAKHREFAEASNSLERIASAAAGDLDIHAVVRKGSDVAHEIVLQSQSQGADLIVMSTHGRAGLGRAVLGSVAERVLARSGVPVMLLRPGGRQMSQIHRLLVPIDGSPGGSIALGAAAGIAKATGASIRLLQVAIPMPVYVDSGYGMTYFDPAWDEETLASARSYVDTMVTRLGEAGFVATGDARREPGVAGTVVTVAEEASVDLIVMSTQALVGPARALLGSVADAVVRNSRCPVLLVHRAETSAEWTPLKQEELATTLT